MEENIFLDILSKGCRTKREASMVKQIYLELCEVKRYWDVQYFFHDAHQKTYIRAKINKTQKPSLFIPNHVSDSTDFLQMKHLLSLNNDNEYHGIFLSFINPDSTCVHYQISEGLVQPKEITSKHLVRNNQKVCDKLIRKHRNLIKDSALYGIPITLNLDNEDKESASCSKNKELKGKGNFWKFCELESLILSDIESNVHDLGENSTESSMNNILKLSYVSLENCPPYHISGPLLKT